MKKLYLVISILLIVASLSYGADSKITALTEDTAPTSDDLVVTVNAPGSSPASRKATVGNLFKWALVPGGSTNVTTITGNYAFGITLTNTTSVTFPTSGTLATTAQLHDAVTLAGTPETNVFSLSTQALSLDTQTANYVFAGPATGAAAAPAFRALVSADIPNNAANTTGNASTATALAANPSNCSAGNYPLGVSDTGAAENCTAAPTAASLHLDDVLTALGIASEAVNFGAFTGSTIADNQTAKAAIQALETAVEAKVSTSSAATYTEPGSNIPLCRTGSGTIGGCTNVTDLAFSSYAPLANPQFTGVVDIPVNATTDAEGEITIDTTTDQLRFYGSAQKVLPSVQYASFVIPAPADTDDINIMKAPYGMTITGINCIVQGTTSATGQLQECSATGGDCADLDSDITCDADGAADDGSLTDSAIASGAWIRWKTTSLSGTPTFLTVTFKYLVVAD